MREFIVKTNFGHTYKWSPERIAVDYADTALQWQDEDDGCVPKTREEYLALFPEYWYVGARYKTTVLDSLLTLRHWQKTGLWEYFYTEREHWLLFEYLDK